MDGDGSAQTKLADGGDPSWSPDGSKIAFVRLDSTGDNGVLYVMNADGSGTTALTSNAWDPAWSPDGAKIAFYRCTGPNCYIYVMNADGSDVTSLAQGEQPTWSPDGSRIAFADVRGSQKEDIYMINADGSHEVRLTDNPATDWFPDWSPDGSNIIFVSWRDGNSEIYVMNADGSGQMNLTHDPAADEDPAWSPDGSEIVWSRWDGDDLEIFVMNRDGSGVTQLTNNTDDDCCPDWQPTTPTSRSTETQEVTVTSGPNASLEQWFALIAAVALIAAILAPVASVLGRRTRQSKVAPAAMFEVSASIPSAGKTVTLEVAPDHTIGSLVETIVSTLNLSKGRTYAVEYAGRLISQPEFGKSLAAFGIKEGSALSLRVVE